MFGINKLKSSFHNKLLKLLIFISIFSKFLLLKGGFLTEPDERLYFWSFSFIKRLSTLDISGALQSLFSARGRPVEVLIKSIPAGFQILSAKIFGLNIFETNNMWVIFVFNMIIYSLILYFLYRISLLIFKSEKLALISVLFYSIIINSFVYLRHIYPYDTSLLLLVSLTYYLLKYYVNNERISLKKSFLLGLTAFLSFMFYPTFYMMFYVLFFIFVWLLYNNFPNEKKYIFKTTMSYILGSVFLLVFVELISHLVGKSYVYNLVNLSGTIDQGNYNESIYFLFRYLIEVERFIGILLIIGLLLFMLKIPKILAIGNKANRFVVFLFLFIVFTYLIHTGILCYGLKKMTVYIRQMHQYMPFLVIFSILGFKFSFVKFDRLTGRFSSVFIVGLIIIFITVLFVQMNDYLKVVYPRDIYWKYLSNIDKSLVKEVSEYEDSWSNLPNRFLDKSKINRDNDTIIAVNTQYFFPVKDMSKYHPFKKPKTKKLIFNGLHFLNYKAYQYEGYTTEERKNIRKMRFRIRIYK